jgi:predicted permease
VKLRKALVTAQVALSFLLLAGAGLFARSLANLRAASTGFETIDNLVTFQVQPALNGYSVERVVEFYRQLLDNVSALPGVRSAAFASMPLLHGYEWDSYMSVEGHQAADGEDMAAFMNSLSPGYFRTMGINLLEGRDFDERNMKRDARVAIVNRKFAEHFFGARSALGRHIGWGSGPESKLDIEIIGVVENSLYEGPREGIRRQVFVPNYGPSSVAFYVRAGTSSKALFAALRGEVKKLDPSMPVYEMKTLESQLDETLSTERLVAALSVAFGALATALAAIGLYGVMAFVVARRTKEIGLRMALGAERGAVVWLVMREVLVLLAAGLAIGVPATLVLGRYVASQLFTVKPADPLTAVSALFLLAVVALFAGLQPALRATRVDPIEALRYE